MRKELFSLLVTLLISTPVFADWLPIGLTPIDNGNPDFETYQVGLRVDDPNGISMVSDMSITGDIVQVWFEQTGVMMPTVLKGLGAFVPSVSNVPEMIFDTRILDLSCYGTGIELLGGDGWTETNDGSLPDLIDPNSPFASYLYCGFGELVLANDPTELRVKGNLPDLDEIVFAQVVVPTGKVATISGFYSNALDDAQGNPHVPFAFTVGTVPEPSTFVMFILGVLCSFGFRRRR